MSKYVTLQRSRPWQSTSVEYEIIGGLAYHYLEPLTKASYLEEDQQDTRRQPRQCEVPSGRSGNSMLRPLPNHGILWLHNYVRQLCNTYCNFKIPTSLMFKSYSHDKST